MPRLDLHLGWNAVILALVTAVTAAAQTPSTQAPPNTARTLKTGPTMTQDTLLHRGPQTRSYLAAASDPTRRRVAEAGN